MVVVHAAQRDELAQDLVHIDVDEGVRVHDATEHVVPAGAQHLDARRDHARVAAHLDHGVRPFGLAQALDGLDQLGLAHRRGVEDVVAAEALAQLLARGHRVQADHEPRAAGLGNRAGVQAQQAQPLHHHRVAHADLGLFGHADHGGHTAIHGGGLGVGELVGQAQDPRAGHDVAVLSEAAVMVRLGRDGHVTVLVHARGLLRQVQHLGVVVVAGDEVLAPGDAVAFAQRVAAHVLGHPVTQRDDGADDLVAQHAGRRVGPVAEVGVDVRAADGAHAHLHQHLPRARLADGEHAQLERSVGPVVDGHQAFGGGHGGAHSVPLIAKSKIW